MNPKIFVGAAVGVFAVVIAVVAFSGQNFINDVSDDGLFFSGETNRQVIPITIELDDISIIEVNERAATIEVSFKITNPNYKSVILQLLKYQLFENGTRIHIGEIGERPEGMVTSSNYFTLLSDTSLILSDKATIKNSGNSPELWEALSNNSAKWKILGEANFNLSSMTSGGENEITFEFEK